MLICVCRRCHRTHSAVNQTEVVAFQCHGNRWTLNRPTTFRAHHKQHQIHNNTNIHNKSTMTNRSTYVAVLPKWPIKSHISLVLMLVCHIHRLMSHKQTDEVSYPKLLFFPKFRYFRPSNRKESSLICEPVARNLLKLDADKSVKKPAAKRQRKKPNAPTQSAKQSIDDKKSSNPLPNFGKSNDSYSNAYGTPPNGSTNSSSSLSSMSSSSNVSPHFPAFGSASTVAAAAASASDMPYQPDFKIKQEPLPTIHSRQPYQLSHTSHTPPTYPSTQIKMEGYERNYQNFINYADYCQNQSSTSSTPPSSSVAVPTAIAPNSQEYGQLYGHNYPPYSSGAYHPHSQGYPNSAYNTSGTVPNFSSIPSADANCNSNSPTIAASDARDVKPFAREMDKDAHPKCADLTKLTNYEKDIPVHTYPNHGRFTEHHHHNTMNEHSHHAADGMKNDKLDDVS